MQSIHTALICCTIWATVDGDTATAISVIFFVFAVVLLLIEKYGSKRAEK